MPKEKAEEKQDEPTSQEGPSPIKSFFKNHWAIATIVLAILLLLVLFTNITGNTITGNAISQGDAGNRVIEYLNGQTGGGVELINVEDIGNLYEITVSYQGQNIPVHVTKDGKYFGSMNVIQETQTPSQTPQPTNVPKSDKPVVELFVMTHCPYGTQAEKGFIPAIEALGDSIDASVKFVHYFLHAPEETETPIQICIREEQPTKYLTYLKEFLVAGDSQAALTKAGIDKSKLDSCIANKYEDLYATDSALSEGYGVRGSPTLVINGVQSQSGRSSAAYLDSICATFNTAPEACSLDLSAENPSPGFGYSTTSTGGSASTAAQC